MAKNIVEQLVAAGRDMVEDRGKTAVERVIASSELQKILDVVEERAREGVVTETKKNAISLFALAVAGGAIGGMIFRGKVGGAVAGVLALWAGRRLLSGQRK